MDFERATLKALFYDYPIEGAVRAIKNSHNVAERDIFMDILPQLVRWRETAFTTTEARLLQDGVKHHWLSVNSDEQNPDAIPYVCRPLLLVKHMAERMLDFQIEKSHGPVVRFENLFRWKDVTSYVGEDLFTTALYAAHDARMLRENTHVFAWPDTIAHNDPDINRVLNHGLADIHSHYYASSDVFHLNWINVTNNLSDSQYKWFEKDECYQDIALSTVGTQTIYPYRRLCIAAAWLRLILFQIFVLDLPESERELDIKKVFDILEDEATSRYMSAEINSFTAAYRVWALHTPNDHAIDYALVADADTIPNRDNVFIIHHGERRLLYRFFLRYFEKDTQAWQISPYFYLYILLKNRIRSEFVQINKLKGFENFETYQNRKDMFISGDSQIGVIYAKYALQSSVRLDKEDFLEARIAPKDLSVFNQDFGHSAFSTNTIIPNVSKYLSFVVHFIKENYSRANIIKNPIRRREILVRRDRHYSDGYSRYSDYRRELKFNIDRVLSEYNRQQNYSAWDPRNTMPRIVGIDAASTEMFCRPEVFAHIFRFACAKGMHNRTYHVGEDFFDITDGLRAIDEALTFLELDGGCRIGHALAIGVSPEEYYHSRRLRILQPAQYILDNCVWICMRAAEADINIPNSLETYLVSLAKRMYEHIGYKPDFNRYTYWNSMLLRGDEPEYYMLGEMPQQSCPPVSDWERTALIRAERIDHAREDENARRIYSDYHYSSKIKNKGSERMEDKFPPDIIPVVKQLQQWTLHELAKRHITIECNPTSNLKIGFFGQYDQHPLLTTFDSLSQLGESSYPSVCATVNTDDRGVFGTSIYNELSLIALAMRKIKDENNHELYNERTIIEYIERIRRNAYDKRFK